METKYSYQESAGLVQWVRGGGDMYRRIIILYTNDKKGHLNILIFPRENMISQKFKKLVAKIF